MAETIGSIIDLINEVYPNGLNSSTLLTIINRESKKLYPYLTNSTINTTNITTTSDSGYPLPSTDVHFDMLESVYVGDTTADSSTIYQEYTYAPSSNDLTGYKYYNAFGNNVGLFPEPTTSDLPIVLKYREPPVLVTSTSDSSTFLNFNDDLTQVLMDNVLSRIAKSGRFPRVTLANNYAIDGLASKRDMMLREKKRVAKNPDVDKWDWRDW